MFLYNDSICWITGGGGKIINTTNGGQTLVGISNSEEPQKFILEQNYPNPFNPNTKIKYSINKRSFIEVKIFNVLGIEIQTFVNIIQNPGNYEIDFNASDINSGVYFYTLIAGGEKIETKRMIFLK